MSMMSQMPLGLWLIWHLQRCWGCMLEIFAPLLPDTSGASWYVQSPHLIIDATEGTNHSSTESFKRNMNRTIPCNSRIMVLSRRFQHVWPYTYKILKSAFPPSKDARSRKGGSAVSRCDAQPTTKRYIINNRWAAIPSPFVWDGALGKSRTKHQHTLLVFPTIVELSLCLTTQEAVPEFPQT